MIKIDGRIILHENSISSKEFMNDLKMFLKNKNAELDGILEIVDSPEESMKKMEDIHTLDISNRIKNILVRYKIYTLQDISKCTQEDVHKFRGMGPEAFKELDAALKKKGIILTSYLEETKDFSKGFSKEERYEIYKAGLKSMKDVLTLSIKELDTTFGRTNLYEKLLKKRLEYIQKQKYFE